MSTVVDVSAARLPTAKVAPPLTATAPLAREPEPLRFNVPAVTFVAPVNVFTPLKVSTPLPSFVNEPAPSASTPLAAMSPEPPKVTPRSAADNVPPNVNKPESELIRVAVFSVSEPPKMLVPEILRNAPLLAAPVPLKVSGSAPTEMLPCNCNAAPSATVVAPAVVPSAAPF